MSVFTDYTTRKAIKWDDIRGELHVRIRVTGENFDRVIRVRGNRTEMSETWGQIRRKWDLFRVTGLGSIVIQLQFHVASIS